MTASNRRPDAGVAKFDSATAMLRALSRFLHGRDFPGLGQARLLQAMVRRADRVPRRLRERLFATLGAREAVPAGRVDEVSMAQVAEWAAGHYPSRRYPALMIGSSNGALVHMAAALGIPWLPQTFLTLVEQDRVHPDDAVGAMEAERETACRFLSANPDSQLHHMHDPSQDRLMLGLITYFRSKFLRLPAAYRSFIERSLAPGATIFMVECNRRWPTTRLGDRHFYQFGAVGGPTPEEYFHGGPRVAAYLQRYGSPTSRWRPPPPDGDSPEAEWGFEPALREDVIALARAHGYRVVRLVFDDPESPSPLVADFHRAWYRERGLAARRLVVESFVLLEPYWMLRTASVPLWMTFNMQPSLEHAQRYLDEAEASGAPFDEIYLMLFAHGVDSVGLPPIEAWRRLVDRARERGGFLGIDPATYPAHFAHFARYSQALRREVAARQPLPPPLAPERMQRFIEDHGARHGVRLECVQGVR